MAEIKDQKSKHKGKRLICWRAYNWFYIGYCWKCWSTRSSLFLGLNLHAAIYIASEAVAAFLMHLTKIIVYQKYTMIDLTGLGYGVFRAWQ